MMGNMTQKFKERKMSPQNIESMKWHEHVIRNIKENWTIISRYIYMAMNAD